jgi:L-ascorbate metabolism protein UlaG (beta-lactamase superfamily)
VARQPEAQVALVIPLRITYLGGPTALIEWGGVNLLTDPTFDPAGTTYPTPAYTLRKTIGPAISLDALPRLDAILLSHDHHFDNLDNAGRALLPRVGRVFTTQVGAGRLGVAGTVGLAPWDEREILAPDGRVLRITATPARHGPPHADRGPVIGFLLAFSDDPTNSLYISGDTVWYEGVQQVATRFSIRAALLFLGAARVAAAGEWNLTLTAAEAVEVARVLSAATIVPLHFEGWEHFSEHRIEVDQAFAAAGLQHRLRLAPGRPTILFPSAPG